MLGAVLRNLDAPVRGVYHLLLHAVHLVAEDNGVFLAAFRLKIFQRDAVLRLLDGENGVSLCFEYFHGREGLFKIAPRHGVFCPQRGLVNFHVGRGGGNTAEDDLRYSERVARAEHRPNVVLASHVIEHHHQRLLFGFLELLDTDPVQLLYFQFSSLHIIIFQGLSKKQPHVEYTRNVHVFNPLIY